MDQLKVPWTWIGLSFLILGFLVLPLAVVVAGSFTNDSYIAFPPKNVGLDAFRAIGDHPAFISSLWVSCLLAASVAVIATLVGTAAAIGIAWSTNRVAAVMQTFLLGPLMIPALVLGLALLQGLSLSGIRPGLLALFLGHLALALPYVGRVVGSQLVELDPNQERAARSLGAGPPVFLVKVLLPALRPSLVGASVFAFVVSFDDVSMAIFLSSATVVTLPVQIYSYVQYSFEPFVLALSTLIIFGTVAIGIILERTIGLDVLFGSSAGKRGFDAQQKSRSRSRSIT